MKLKTSRNFFFKHCLKLNSLNISCFDWFRKLFESKEKYIEKKLKKQLSNLRGIENFPLSKHEIICGTEKK